MLTGRDFPKRIRIQSITVERTGSGYRSTENGPPVRTLSTTTVVGGPPRRWELPQRFFFRTTTLDCSCRSRFAARRCSRVDEGFFSDFPRDLSATVAPFSEVPSDRLRPYVRKNKKPVRRSRTVRARRPPRTTRRRRPVRGHLTPRRVSGIDRCAWNEFPPRGVAARGPSERRGCRTGTAGPGAAAAARPPGGGEPRAGTP